MIICHLKFNYHVQRVEIWKRNIECDDLICAWDVWCHTSRSDIKASLLENVISLSLSLLNVSQSELTHTMDHNPTFKYQVSL